MKLQRYDGHMYQDSPAGSYVDFDDAMDWFLSLLDRPITDHYDWSEREIVTTERARLRAILAAERGM